MVLCGKEGQQRRLPHFTPCSKENIYLQDLSDSYQPSVTAHSSYIKMQRPLQKIKLEWIKGLNVSRNHKIPRRKHEGETLTVVLAMISFGYGQQKAQVLKAESNMWGCIKLRSFSTAKNQQMNRLWSRRKFQCFLLRG